MTHSSSKNTFCSEQERKRKIDSIRKLIEIGAYRINSTAVAEAVLRSMQESGLSSKSVKRRSAA